MGGFDEMLFQTYLREVPMFAACSGEELSALAGLASPRAVDAGNAIVQEGTAGDEFFVIMMGRATVARGEHELATLDAGDFFGELALFDPAPRNATVSAKGPCTLVVLHRDGFQWALDASPTLRDALLRGMARRLHNLDAKV
jgi:CRP-like cAMP-binding protein